MSKRCHKCARENTEEAPRLNQDGVVGEGTCEFFPYTLPDGFFVRAATRLRTAEALH
jgi:hypothetical protein